MRRLSRDEYERLIAGADVVSRDAHGEKVLACADGRMVKLFRTKRLVSSAMLRPYAVRFVHAAKRLRQRGFETVRVAGAYRLPHLRRQAVVYEPLQGLTLREVAAAGAPKDVMLQFAAFVAKLHARGVYFRAIHFGNVIVLSEGNFGLIDVSEARFFRSRLRTPLRARNFKPMVRYPEDRDAIATVGWNRLLERYLAAADLSERAQRRFLAHLDRLQLAPHGPEAASMMRFGQAETGV